MPLYCTLLKFYTFFYGKEANRMEKAKAVELTKRINYHECGGRAQIITIKRKGDPDYNDGDAKRDEATRSFWEKLGGKEEEVQSAEAGGNDIAFERVFQSQLALEQITKELENGEASYKVSVVDFGALLSRTLLNSDKCFLLDCGPGCIFLWLGKSCSNEMKTWAVDYANQVKSHPERPQWAYVEKEADGGESITFREKFVGWSEADDGPASTNALGLLADCISPRKKKTGTLNRAKARVRVSAMEKKKMEQEKVDIRALHTGVRPSLEAPWANDDGQNGTVEAWIINNYDLEELPKEQHGIFYSGESYIILYTYRHGGFTGQSEQIRWLLYYWQGRDATHKDKGATALKTKEIVNLVKGRGGDPDQVRVSQGKEPLHFLKMFQNRMVVHMGLREKHEKKDALYHVRGLPDSFAIRAVEVPFKMKWLNSRDSFIMVYGGKQYIWQGEGTNDELLSVAQSLVKVIASEFSVPSSHTLVKEGHESTEWHKTFAKVQKYPNSAHIRKKGGWQARLFVCSSTSGEFSVEQIFDYAQEDLETNNVYILDTWAEVFVWIGSKSYEEDERMAMETALSYVQAATDGRLLDTPIYAIKEGEEPREFTCHFQAWDNGWGAKSVNSTKKKVKKNAQIQNVRDILKELNRVYTYEELRAKKDLPKGIDKTKLESYLSDEDFKRLLKMDKALFYQLPAWKQNNLRKEVDLY